MNVPDQNDTYGGPAESNSQQPIESTPTLPPRIEALTASIGPGSSGTVTLPPAPFAHIPADGLRPFPVVPGYEIIAEIGRGGMGVVFKARQIKLNRLVALKMILSGNYASQTDLVRFVAEAEAVAALQHPNIVQIFEIGQHDGLPYFTLEFVEGGTLSDKVREHPMQAKEAGSLVEQIARGVQFAHDKGLVHRDLKPDNVLLTANGAPKVTDFGLAKRVQTPSGLTQAGTVLGTPSYMAPEQADGKGMSVGPRADVYALGAILYRLIAGRPPFQAATPLDTLMQVVSDEAVPPSQLQSKTPKDVETICLKCLQKEPERRYESAAALADDLDRFMRGEPIVARPVGVFERGWKWIKRNQVVTGLLGAVIITLIAGALVSYLKYREANIQRNRAENALFAEAEQRRTAENAKNQAETALKSEAEQRKIAEKAQEEAMSALRATSDDVIIELIGSKPVLGPKEKAFLESVLNRWQVFAAEKGDGELARRIRAEGLFRVAVLRENLGQLEQAENGYRESLALYQGLVANYPSRIEYRQAVRDDLNNLGLVQGNLGKISEAEDSIRQALKVSEALATEFPSNSGYRHKFAQGYVNLGYRFQLASKLREAEAPYLRAQSILSTLVAEAPTDRNYRGDLAKVQYDLGALYMSMGRPVEAESVLRQALPTLTSLVEQYPALREYRQDLAKAHGHLGDVLEDSGRLLESETNRRESFVLCKKLAADFPAILNYGDDLVASCISLARIMKKLGKLPEAEGFIREYLATTQKLADESPNNSEYRYKLALTGINLALLLADSGRLGEAETAMRKLAPILEKLVADFPIEPKYGTLLGGCRCDLATMLQRSKGSEESLDWFGKAIAALENVLRKSPDYAQAKDFALNAHSGRAQALENLMRYEEAVADWDHAIDLSRNADRLGFRISRARVWAKAGMLERATTEADVAAKGASPHIVYGAACVFALAHSRSSDDRHAARAVELLRRAATLGLTGIALVKKNPDLNSLRDRADFKQLIVDLEKKSPPNGGK